MITIPSCAEEGKGREEKDTRRRRPPFLSHVERKGAEAKKRQGGLYGQKRGEKSFVSSPTTASSTESWQVKKMKAAAQTRERN